MRNGTVWVRRVVAGATATGVTLAVLADPAGAGGWMDDRVVSLPGLGEWLALAVIAAGLVGTVVVAELVEQKRSGR